MNERIKELAAAARHYTNDTVLHLERVHNRDYSFEEINEILDTKFAELIVQECASVLNSRDDSDTGFWANIIKEHFGVE